MAINTKQNNMEIQAQIQMKINSKSQNIKDEMKLHGMENKKQGFNQNKSK